MSCRGVIYPEKLPRTERVAYFHGLRAHYQVLQWSLLDDEFQLQVLDWGWMHKGIMLVPITTDMYIVSFNNSVVTSCESQKHLGLILDRKLVFDRHIGETFSKVNKGIGLITSLRKFVPRVSLVTIYKAFFRPHLDYGDIIYDNPGNASFTRKLESIQYNAALAITGCIRGTSREKLYSELGMESLEDRRFSRRLCSFYKIVKGQAPQYLQTFIPTRRVASVSLRFRPAICPLYARTEGYRNSFFHYCISKWNELDCHIRSLPSIAAFKRAILKFIRPSLSPSFKVINHSTKGWFQSTTKKNISLDMVFLDIADPFYSCRTNAIETTENFLLHCSNFSDHRTILF